MEGKRDGPDPVESFDNEPLIPEVDVGDDSLRDEPEVKETALVPTDPLQRYLAETRRYPLLSEEDEHRLAVDYKESGDLEAAYQMVQANLRLVVMIARRYERTFWNLFDLIQEGNIGLMEAVKKFDPYRGVRFPSYAVWWIRAYIIRYVMNNFRLVKVGTTQAQRRLFFNLHREKQRLEAEGFEITPKLIAQNLDVKPKEVVEMDQRMGARDLSVDAPVGGEEGGSTLLDVLEGSEFSPEDIVAEVHDHQQISARMREFGETLTGKDRTIFEERLLADDPKTLQEIGDIYGVSRERIRQVEEGLKKRLRVHLLSGMTEADEEGLISPSAGTPRKGT